MFGWSAAKGSASSSGSLPVSIAGTDSVVCSCTVVAFGTRSSRPRGARSSDTGRRRSHRRVHERGRRGSSSTIQTTGGLDRGGDRGGRDVSLERDLRDGRCDQEEPGEDERRGREKGQEGADRAHADVGERRETADDGGEDDEDTPGPSARRLNAWSVTRPTSAPTRTTWTTRAARSETILTSASSAREERRRDEDEAHGEGDDLPGARAADDEELRAVREHGEERLRDGEAQRTKTCTPRTASRGTALRRTETLRAEPTTPSPTAVTHV